MDILEARVKKRTDHRLGYFDSMDIRTNKTRHKVYPYVLDELKDTQYRSPHHFYIAFSGSGKTRQA